jgi:hypothetical protein
VSLDGQRYETSTGADGTFTLTGVANGLLRIEPVLPDHLTLPPQQNGGMAQGGCLTIDMRATLNGRIRGRVVLGTDEPFHGFVDLVPHGHTRYVPNSRALTNERGDYAFSALPPGDYLLGINVLREPQDGAPFQPTYFAGATDRSLATPVTVGRGTEHIDVDWVVSARLPEGTIEVSLDTPGQPQKNMGVCVTMFDGNNRNNGGVGYERRGDQPVIVKVVEGVRYRLVAHAQTAAGYVQSEIFDTIGARGHQVIRLPMAETTERGMGSPCASAHSNQPFSLPR